MIIHAIDPGPLKCGVVTVYDDERIAHAGVESTDSVIANLYSAPVPIEVVVEEVECYGMAVGRSVFDTVKVIGRIIEACSRCGLPEPVMLPRRQVKIALCNSAKAKDPNIRQAIIDRYGGKHETKKGGALYGVKTHAWSALAIALTRIEQLKETERAAR